MRLIYFAVSFWAPLIWHNEVQPFNPYTEQ